MTLPVAPLVEALPKQHRGTPARFLRVGGHRWTEYVESGLTIEQADRLAVRAGMHPSEVWGDAIWADIDLEAVPA
jgi:hypothetical protein